MDNVETYDMLLDLLEAGAARYRLVGHEPQGLAPRAGHAVGHALGQAARCDMVRINHSEQANRFVLAVVPGDRRVALETLREMWGGTHVSFVTQETAAELSGCVVGALIPFSFSFHPDLALVVDEDLLVRPEICFNAARPDESIVLSTEDYLRLARPRVARISEPVELAKVS